MEQQIKITDEYLQNLPKVQVNHTGDMVSWARYDQENNRVFLLDQDGRFNGKVAAADKLIKSAKTKVPEQPAAVPEPLKEDGEEPDIPDEEEEDAALGEGKKKWLMYGILGLAVVAVIVVAVILGRASKIVKDQIPETEPPQIASEESRPSEAPTQETVPEKNVQVLACANTLLPGHVLTQQDFYIEEISEIDYKLLAGICGHYTEADAQKLIDQAVTAYLPAGSYLNYNNVAVSYSPINPWSAMGDKRVLVPLAVKITDSSWEQYLWGNEATVNIVAQTKITTEKPEPEEQEQEEATLPNGIKYSNSVVESMVIDTYEIHNVQIVDVQGAGGNSLFPQYASLAQIPSGHLYDVVAAQYDDPEAVQKLIPATIIVALPEEEAALVASLKADSLNVSITHPVPVVSSELQIDLYGKIQSVADALAYRLGNLEQEKK